MTFSRPLTGTIAFEGIVPSSFLNNLNNNFANALDKTGDNAGTSPPGGISGLIEVLSTGTLQLDAGSGITSLAGSVITLESSAEAVVQSGAFILLSGTMNVESGGLINVESGGNITIEAQPVLGSSGISFGTGSIQSSLSFGSQVGTVFIEQVGQSATAANGNSLNIQAQAGGSGILSTGGTLVLAGGVGGATGGNVQIIGGPNGLGEPIYGNILLGGNQITGGEIIVFNSMIQKNWQGTNTGQGQQTLEFVWMGQSTGSSTPSYTFLSLAAGQTAAVYMHYTFRNVSTISDSGAAMVNAVLTGTGSGSATGAVFGITPTTGGNPPEPANDDISFTGGPSCTFFVNGNGFSGTYNWTCWVKVIIN